MIGARVIKTSLAVTISVLVAKSFHLYAFQFAGIVSVLSVQPSIYRSLRYGVQQTISAVIGALFGAAALFAFGGSYLAMGLVTLLMMTLHVKIKWTNSLLISVVIAINTMGTTGLSFLEAAWNQVALVLIGTGIGTIINSVHKPVHHERAENVLIQSEGMLRSLLYFMNLELQEQRVTPYTIMKEQIDNVRKYIEKGKEISKLVIEDRYYHNKYLKNTHMIFQSFETMLERIRDMSKAHEGVEIVDEEIRFSSKAISLVIKLQENIMHGKKTNLNLLERTLDKKRQQMWQDCEVSKHFTNKLAYYNFYGYLKEYIREMEHFLVENLGPVKKKLTYVSLDRPALLSEIAAIVGKNGLNITDVTIQVGGDFATTTIEISCPVNFQWGGILETISRVDHVLTVRVD